MIYDISQCNGETTVHLFSDLEACYNSKFLEIGGIVEESTSINRKVIQLITKMVVSFKYYMRIGFEISKELYREKDEYLAGTEQGNMLSRTICQD